jgi:hypothetical protein
VIDQSTITPARLVAAAGRAVSVGTKRTVSLRPKTMADLNEIVSAIWHASPSQVFGVDGDNLTVTTPPHEPVPPEVLAKLACTQVMETDRP